ncbi:MAG TPA: hypothetical protein VHB51_04365 [Candidatus Saccharimonadales bacterium]|nr:hypothetical protein [Candidatus Saccharimonadales bacterium]
MFSRRSLQQFGLRFIVCVLVLGGLYLAIFGWHPHRHQLPNTPQAKIVRLRTALDQTYIDSSNITSFKQNDPASYALLNSLIGKLQSDVKSLAADLQAAPGKVPTADKAQIKAVIDQEKGGVAALQARYSLLNQVIAYDPQADLGNLDLGSDNAKVVSRAAAAAKGLQAVANSHGGLVTADDKSAINKAAGCFSQLASQLKAGSGSQAADTRATCISDYPLARQAAIANVIQGGLPDTYQNYLKQHIPPLLIELMRVSR